MQTIRITSKIDVENDGLDRLFSSSVYHTT